MTLEELEAIVKKHMILADEGIIKLLCAFVVAARLPIKPPWLFIVGASSGGKSMMLKALEKCKGVRTMDDLSANTFASGMKSKYGDSQSLLDELLPNAVLTFKDFTTILSKEKESKGIVVGQLRKIYDGDFHKTYGNGVKINWEGKISVLAGVTSKIYTTMSQFADMGERFLMYTFTQPDRTQMARFSADAVSDRDAPAEMKEAFAAFIDGIAIPDDKDKMPVIDEQTKEELIALSEFVTRARSAVERNEFGRGHPIKQVHFAEMPGRFVTQVIALALGLQIVNGGGEILEADRKILRNIALDSIPNMRRICLQKLVHYKQIETAALALMLNLPTDSIREPLQDLAAHEVVVRSRTSANHDRWELKEEYRQLLSKFEGITITDEVLEESDAEVAEYGTDQPDALRDAALDVFGITNEE